MNSELEISLFDMVICLSDALDLVNPVITGHHKRVAYIAASIAREMDLSREEIKDILIAGALHDVGTLALDREIDDLFFDFSTFHDVGNHAEIGYKLLNQFIPFRDVSKIIRYHHTHWNRSKLKSKYPLGSHILHLADRIDVLIDLDSEILAQSEEIKREVKEQEGTVFNPEVVTAFFDLAKRESFWFNIISDKIDQTLEDRATGLAVDLDLELLLQLARVFGQIIDFRSPFTATHSSGVAASAETLSKLVGVSKSNSIMLRVAGYLHDLGKLAISSEVLNKEGKLTNNEFNIVKKHAFYTYRILSRVEGLDEVKQWAAFHHERLNGTGYPFCLTAEQLSLESRIMAVADVFTAITEDRPYRKGMNQRKATKVLVELVENSALDKEIVDVLLINYQEIDRIRDSVQTIESEEYQKLFQQTYKTL
ncbi:HD domain-containing protein [Halanaerocella petrolearia]